jgi:hypothetical protein
MKIASAFGGALVGLCLAVASGSVWAGPVVEFGTSSAAVIGLAPQADGWSFTTNQAITVSALDLWTGTATSGRTVRLYDASLSVLASALVATSDPVVGAPTTFYSHAITPVSLLANTTYYIVADLVHLDVANDLIGPLTVNPAITYLNTIVGLGAGSFPTTDGSGGAAGTAFFGPNFEILAAAVPEPAASALLLAGLGLVRVARRRRPRTA